jgi:hypothetical protein
MVTLVFVIRAVKPLCRDDVGIGLDSMSQGGEEPRFSNNKKVEGL